MATRSINLDQINSKRHTLSVTSGGKQYKLLIKPISYGQMNRLKELEKSEDEDQIANELDKVIEGDITINQLRQDENMTVDAVLSFLSTVIEMTTGQEIEGNFKREEPVIHKKR